MLHKVLVVSGGVSSQQGFYEIFGKVLGTSFTSNEISLAVSTLFIELIISFNQKPLARPLLYNLLLSIHTNIVPKQLYPPVCNALQLFNGCINFNETWHEDMYRNMLQFTVIIFTQADETAGKRMQIIKLLSRFPDLLELWILFVFVFYCWIQISFQKEV